MKHLFTLPLFIVVHCIITVLASLVWLFDRKLYHATDLCDCFMWECIKIHYKNFSK